LFAAPALLRKEKAGMKDILLVIGLLLLAWLLLAIVEALPTLPAYHAIMGGH
jgi:hypothetical protein